MSDCKACLADESSAEHRICSDCEACLGPDMDWSLCREECRCENCKDRRC